MEGPDCDGTWLTIPIPLEPAALVAWAAAGALVTLALAVLANLQVGHGDGRGDARRPEGDRTTGSGRERPPAGSVRPPVGDDRRPGRRGVHLVGSRRPPPATPVGNHRLIRRRRGGQPDKGSPKGSHKGP